MQAATSWPPPLPPGRASKFAVVDPSSGARSSTWRVSTGKNVDQIYLMELVTGPVWKVSLHNEPGHLTGEPAWRIAMTAEETKELGTERPVVDHWIPPKPDGGWVEGVGVLIPFAYLRRSTEPLDASVLKIPIATACAGFSVRIFLEEVGAVGTAFPPGLPIAILERCSGGRVYILAVPAQLAERQFDAFGLMCNKARIERSATVTYPTDRFVGVARIETQRLLIDLSIS